MSILRLAEEDGLRLFILAREVYPMCAAQLTTMGIQRRANVRIVRDVLKYHLDKGYSQRRIELVTGISRKTINRIIQTYKELGLPWPLPAELDDELLDHKFNPHKRLVDEKSNLLDLNYVDEEMKKPGATLAELHVEWQSVDPEEHRLDYSTFCRKYRKWKKSQKLSMRSEARYGEAAYVDYSGKKVVIHDQDSGEILTAEIFVGVLGGSQYVYAEASWSQRIVDFLGSHVNMFEYFGGVPQSIVPDNLKSAVIKAYRHDPTMNESYLQLCRYYGTTPWPARAGKPKDKPHVEMSVLLVQRWILFRLRNRKFFTMAELNRAIRELLEEFNHRKFQKRNGTRFSCWLAEEKPLLMPLPDQPYELAEWGKVRAGPDYLVLIDEHRYSVPSEKRNQEFDYRLTQRFVELLQLGKSIVTHERSRKREKMTILPHHRPPAHAAVAGWTSEKALEWASKIGPATAGQLAALLDRVRGPYSGYRTTCALQAIAKSCGEQRMESVCSYAGENHVLGTARLRDILNKGLDLLERENSSSPATTLLEHKNIRGASYYEQVLSHNEGEPSK